MIYQRRKLFIGLPLSPALRKRLTREIGEWPKEAIIPTREENLHITLMFLGYVYEDQIPEVTEKLIEATEGVPFFELHFTKMELLDSEENPKMIWLTGEPSEELKNLHERIEKAFSSFVTERKAYRPHITLAKTKKPKWLALPKKPILKDSLSLMESIDSVVLFESLDIEGKRHYEPIDTFPLA
ncbi:MAG: RNA 2',3'-cyclic phosphodiesterase [Patescibacteria group bacterium]